MANTVTDHDFLTFFSLCMFSVSGSQTSAYHYIYPNFLWCLLVTTVVPSIFISCVDKYPLYLEVFGLIRSWKLLTSSASNEVIFICSFNKLATTQDISLALYTILGCLPVTVISLLSSLKKGKAFKHRTENTRVGGDCQPMWVLNWCGRASLPVSWTSMCMAHLFLCWDTASGKASICLARATDHGQ